MIHVVAAFLEDGDKFLLCRRPAEKARGLKWEFPGGKIEPDESPEAALIRELQEELGITVTVHEKLAEVPWNYPDVSIHLSLFRCRLSSGHLTLLEHQAMAWVSAVEADQLDLAQADLVLLEMVSF